MILPNTLTALVTLTPKSLAKVLDASGYTMCSFKTAEFVGISTGSKFCYKVSYYDETGTGDTDTDMVFVKFDHKTQAITAEYCSDSQ